MSRTAKSRKSQPARKSAGGTLIGMFIGIVLGIVGAALVVWYLNKAPLPFSHKEQQAPSTELPANGQPLGLPGKPGDPMPEKRFQFYDILPGKADAVPDKTAAKPAPAPDAAPKADAAKPAANKDDAKESKESKETKETKDSKAPLFLQVGSFSTAEDADNQKAKLAFMGLEAVVQQVMIQDKTLYRVRVGPYTKIDELNKARAELAKSGIEAQLAK